MAHVSIPYKPRYPEVHKTLANARFCVIVAHRRFGKTVLAVNHLIMQAALNKKPQGMFAYVAPFRTQAKAVAWDYLKHYTRNFPGRKVNESELSVDLPACGTRSRIRIFGADNPDALRGLYFDGVVLDEVAQMKPDVWGEIIQPALADRRGWAVFIGTPKGVNLFSELFNYANEQQADGSKEWAALRFPVDETNALPAEEVERLRRELSESKFRQEMCCDFSASSDDILISLDDVDAALARTPDMEMAKNWPIIIGVDVARFGEDATVFFPRRGPCAMAPRIIRKRSNTDVARELAAFIEGLKPGHVCIDQGQGTGVIDLAKELCPGSQIIEVPFGSKAMDDQRFANRRAEMWTRMRDWLKGGNASLPKAQAGVIRQELTAPTYSFDPSGRIKLEPKEEITKRLKHSTDVGDALALTFAVNAIPVEHRSSMLWADINKGGEYDPWAS